MMKHSLYNTIYQRKKYEHLLLYVTIVNSKSNICGWFYVLQLNIISLTKQIDYETTRLIKRFLIKFVCIDII